MLKFIFIFSIFILSVTGLVYLFFRSPFLEVAEVEVLGSSRSEDIKNELISNLVKNSTFHSLVGPKNLLFWSPKSAEKIPSSLFWLSELSLKRNWQLKKISIGVKERQHWLIWCVSESQRCYWLDDSGIVFAFAPQAEGFIIPKVIDENDRQLLFGQIFFSNPKLVKNTLEIIKKLKDSSLAINCFFIKKLDLQEMEVETNGPKLYFSLRFLPQNLNKLLTDLAGRLDFPKLGYIDFRVENRIYYK